LHADYVPIGHSTNLAARMEQMATPGSILVTAYTHKLTEGYFAFKALGQTQIKGVEEPLDVFEVLGAGPLRTRLQVTATRRGLTRFVGRQRELEQLHQALAHAKVGHGQIVGVMGEKNRRTAPLLCHFRKERITRLARGGFDRHFSIVGDRANIRGSDFKIDVVIRGEFFHEARIGLGRAAPQLMVEMANDQFAITEIDHAVQQRDRVAPAGNTDEVARVWREPAKQGCLNLNPIHPVIASNVRRLTMNDHRHLNKMRSRRRLHHKRRVAYCEQRT